jgi:hypothetical protein
VNRSRESGYFAGSIAPNPKYDYQNQAWTSQEPEDVRRYEDCGHPEKTMKCSCHGRLHAGEPVTAEVLAQIAQHDQDNEDMRRLGVDAKELVRLRREAQGL